MATATYSGNFGKVTAGSEGKSIWLSGPSIPAGSVINSVYFTLSMSATRYSSSWKWQLKHFYIGDGSPYASEQSSTMSSTKYTFSGYLNSPQDGLNEFVNGGFYVYARGNNSASSSSSTSYMNEVTITVDYSTASLGTPGTPSVSQTNAGAYSISWSAPSYSGGSGSPYYYVLVDGDVEMFGTSSTRYTWTIPTAYYGVSHSFSIRADYSGLTTWGSSKSFTATKPSISAPTNLKVTSAKAQTCALSWTASSLSKTIGTITYSIRKNGTEVATTTSTSYTFAESTTKGWGTSAVTMTVVAKGTGLSNTVNNTVTTLTSGASSGVSYTYTPVFSAAPSNLKINSSTSYTGPTAPLSWTAATLSSGATITYSIRVDNTEVATTTSTSYTIAESITKSYTAAKTITIVATGSGITSSASNGVTYTYQPTITAASNLKINSAASYTGRTAPLTWTAGSLSNGATVTYSLRKGGTEFATTTSTSYTVAEDVTKGWGTSAVTLTVVATGSGKTASASNGVTYTYQPAFTANPTNLKINGAASYSGQTAPLTWTAATISNSATITYTIYKGTDVVTTTTSTSYTIPESTTKAWSGSVTLKVVASASGVTSSSSPTVTYTYSPAITAPSNLKVAGGSSFIGQTAQLTWTAGSLSSGATITYSIRKNGTEFATTTSTSYTIPESTAINWGTNPVTIAVFATGGGKVSNSSNEITFTYKPPYKTVKYNTGNGWVECIAYYHDGTRWVKCDSYYYNGGWKLSDH